MDGSGNVGMRLVKLQCDHVRLRSIDTQIFDSFC